MTTKELISLYLGSADSIVEASRISGVPVHIVCAIVEQESNGLNVYGKDAGGIFSSASSNVVYVTEQNFKEFRQRLAAGEKSNGVGLTQITWPPYFGDAEVKGYALWKPLDNILYGLKLYEQFLKGDYSVENLAIAATVYNTGVKSSKVNWYGEQVAMKAIKWKSLIENPPKQFDFLKHTVVKGDTLWGISRNYSVDLMKILSSNPTVNPEDLRIGSVVKIPVENYIVQSGDSLWKIYRTTGVSVDEIARLNDIDLNNYEIHSGQVLRVR